VVQLEINGELQSNASDVTTQFLAELRVYTTLARHRNIVGFLGCLEGVGMVLEYIDGRTLLDVIRARPVLTKDQKIDYHNQLLDGLSHLHSYGLSHGDLSLLNVYVTTSTDTLKLIDFGRSVAADSFFNPPTAEPEDPFAFLARSRSGNHHSILPKKTHSHQHFPRKVEQIHLGTRPFTAPEIIRQECQDARLADAYSFGVMLVCLDVNALVDCEPAMQSKDEYPGEWLLECEVFRERVEGYLRRCDSRKRIVKEDAIAVKSWWDDD
jgi:serine/threonine protein kinase